MKKMDKIKLKAERGEGTYDQWDAVSQWIGNRTRYVADDAGNWVDTEYWNMMKDGLYRYQQSHGQQPILKTWVNNAYFDADSKATVDSAGITLHRYGQRPSMRVQAMPQKPTLWYLEQMEKRIEILWPIMARARNAGAVIFGCTVQSPNSDGHIRKFTVNKADVKDVKDFIDTKSSRVLYHPSGERKKVITPNVRLYNANMTLPKGIKFTAKVTPSHAEEFFAWAGDAKKVIKSMKADAKSIKTLNDIAYFTKNVTTSMRRYIDINAKVTAKGATLVERIAKHEDNMARARLVADAIIAYRGLDMTIEELETAYKTPRSERPLGIDSGLISATYSEISQWSYNLKWNHPQRSFDSRLLDLKNARDSITGNASRVKQLAPLGGEAKINEAIASVDYVGGAQTVEEFFAIHEGADLVLPIVKVTGDEE